MSIIPYVFVGGTPVSAEQVNANFSALAAAVGTLAPAIPWTGGTIGVNQGYLIDTSSVYQIVPLPELSSVPLGSFAMLIDESYNAGNNHIIAEGYAGDTVFNNGVAGTSYPIQTSGTILILYATALGWRDFLIGG